jgi:hypothetical protein
MPESRYRAGPWPGLTPTGALILLGCAVLLGLAQTVVGNPHRALPDLPLLAITTLVPLLLGTRIVRAPGAASAVCGAYLMPRTLVSLVEPELEPPPLLLVPALALDLAVWIRGADLARLAHAWPRRERRWRKRRGSVQRRLDWPRAAFAGGLFGLVLSAVEPPFAILYGADPSQWMPASLALGGGLAVVACALVASMLSARDTAS